MRGYQRTLPPVDDWPAVVIIEHGSAPDVALEHDARTAFMSLEDWLHLHFRLRSTAAVIDYVERALKSGINRLWAGSTCVRTTSHEQTRTMLQAKAACRSFPPGLCRDPTWSP